MPDLIQIPTTPNLSEDQRKAEFRRQVQKQIEEKWMRSLSYHKMDAGQIEVSEEIRQEIKKLVLLALAIVPDCIERERALGQIEVALMCFTKAIAMNPTATPKP